MNLGLKNKVCCITGGGSNICRATALLFAACDAKTVILDIDEDAAKKTAALANENGGNAIAIRVIYYALSNIHEVNIIRALYIYVCVCGIIHTTYNPLLDNCKISFGYKIDE